VLVKHLKAVTPDLEIIGYDSGFFAHCLTGAVRAPEINLCAQYFGDVRAFPDRLLDGVDAVVYLSAVSNDPMGNKFEVVTDEINHVSAVAVARKALEHGVKSFVFASSCSMYGSAADAPKSETDTLNPLTAYARSKVDSERDLKLLSGKGLKITALRFSTACGMSDRLRLDLVLNDFVACALATGNIKILSDGTPWRPLIDTRDVARAIEWAISREKVNGEDFLAVNVGTHEWNHRVSDLAEAVARSVPGTTISINKEAPPDKRSYQVNFDLFKRLAPRHQPQISLEQSIEELKRGLNSIMFKDGNFHQSQFMRLKVLEAHMAEGILSGDLRWTK
jgi:nucleoside-diphosphate-sugar epimerase